MEAHRISSIILRRKELGESDLLVTFFSADQGRLQGIAKGARKSRRRFVNCLDHFCLSTLEYTERPGRDLCFLQSGKLEDNFAPLRTDYSLLSLASYMVELTEILFPLRVPDSHMFHVLKRCLGALGSARNSEEIRLFFEARAMALGGYGIQLEGCTICKRRYEGEGRAVFQCRRGGIACLRCAKETAENPGLNPLSVKILDQMQEGEWPEKGSLLPLDAEVIREIRPVLEKHLEHRIGKRLKTSFYPA